MEEGPERAGGSAPAEPGRRRRSAMAKAPRACPARRAAHWASTRSSPGSRRRTPCPDRCTTRGVVTRALRERCAKRSARSSGGRRRHRMRTRPGPRMRATGQGLPLMRSPDEWLRTGERASSPRCVRPCASQRRAGCLLECPKGRRHARDGVSGRQPCPVGHCLTSFRPPSACATLAGRPVDCGDPPALRGPDEHHQLGA